MAPTEEQTKTVATNKRTLLRCRASGKNKVQLFFCSFGMLLLFSMAFHTIFLQMYERVTHFILPPKKGLTLLSV